MKRFEVWLARLDPAEGSAMRKTRPVVIVSPNLCQTQAVQGAVFAVAPAKR